MKRIAALTVVATAVGLTGSALAAPAARLAGPPTVKITAEKSGYRYDVKTLTAPAGKPFLLVFTNLSSQMHNVSLEQGELEYGSTLTVGKGGTAAIFTLAKGTYHFYSSVGKDEPKGLSGTLVVR